MGPTARAKRMKLTHGLFTEVAEKHGIVAGFSAPCRRTSVNAPFRRSLDTQASDLQLPAREGAAMSCIKHFLGFQWERHVWDRRVTRAENRSLPRRDMWGRAIGLEQALCHTQYVCRACGAVRDEGECFCEQAEADACAVRLAWLAESREEHKNSDRVEGAPN